MYKNAFSLMYARVSLLAGLFIVLTFATINGYAQAGSEPPVNSEFREWLESMRGKAKPGSLGRLVSANKRPAMQVGSRSAQSNSYSVEIDGRSIDVEVILYVKPSKGTGYSTVKFYDPYVDTEASVDIFQNETVLTMSKSGNQVGTVRWTTSFFNNTWLYDGFSYASVGPWSSQAAPLTTSSGASSMARAIGYSSAVRSLTPYLSNAILYSGNYELYYGTVYAGVPWQAVQPFYEAASVSSYYGWGVPPAF